jgi:TfoX-like protein
MSDPVSSIRNLGPAADSGFGRAGINTADQLRTLGADEAYGRYLSAGGQAHFIGYYALVMGLQGRPWNDCRGPEKIELRKRFDAIKAGVKGTGTSQSKLDRDLARIGVIRR